MSGNGISTRRNFLRAGVALSAPLAAAPVAALADDWSRKRGTQPEDECAIRKLQQGWLCRVNAGTLSERDAARLNSGMPAAGDKVRTVVPQAAGLSDEVDLAAGGKTAIGRYHCTVEIETPIAKNCTAAQMAYLQGGGFVRRTERRTVVIAYLKTYGTWSIATAGFAAVETG
jgi:hypothetical protein